MEFPRIASFVELTETHWVKELTSPPCDVLVGTSLSKKPSRKRPRSSQEQPLSLFLNDRTLFSAFTFILTDEREWNNFFTTPTLHQKVHRILLDDFDLSSKILKQMIDSKISSDEYFQARNSIFKMLFVSTSYLSKMDEAKAPAFEKKKGTKSDIESWLSTKLRFFEAFQTFWEFFGQQIQVGRIPSMNETIQISFKLDSAYILRLLVETSLSLLLRKWNLVASVHCRSLTESLCSDLLNVLSIPFSFEASPLLNDQERQLLIAKTFFFFENSLLKALDFIPSFLIALFQKVFTIPSRKFIIAFLNQILSLEVLTKKGAIFSLFIEDCCLKLPSLMKIFFGHLLKGFTHSEKSIGRRHLFQSQINLLDHLSLNFRSSLLNFWRDSLVDHDSHIRSMGIKLLTLHWVLFAQQQSVFGITDMNTFVSCGSVSVFFRTKILLLSCWAVSQISERLLDKNEKVRVASVKGLWFLLYVNPFTPKLTPSAAEKNDVEDIGVTFVAEIVYGKLFQNIYALMRSPVCSQKILGAISDFLGSSCPASSSNWLTPRPSLQEYLKKYLQSRHPLVLQLNYRCLVLTVHTPENAAIIGELLKKTYLKNQNNLGKSLVWIPLANRLHSQQFSCLTRLFQYFIAFDPNPTIQLEKVIPVLLDILREPSKCLEFSILKNEGLSSLILGVCNLLSILTGFFPTSVLPSLESLILPILSEACLHNRGSEVLFSRDLVKPILKVIYSSLSCAPETLNTSPGATKVRNTLVCHSDNLFFVDPHGFVDCLYLFQDGNQMCLSFAVKLENLLKESPKNPRLFALSLVSFLKLVGLVTSKEAQITKSLEKGRQETSSNSERGLETDDYMKNHEEKMTLKQRIRDKCNEMILGSYLGRYVPLLQNIIMMNPKDRGSWWPLICEIALHTLGVMVSWCDKLSKDVCPLLFCISSDLCGERFPLSLQKTNIVILCDLLNRDIGDQTFSQRITKTLLVSIQQSKDPKVRLRSLVLLSVCIFRSYIPFEKLLHDLAFLTTDDSPKVASFARYGLQTLFIRKVKGQASKPKIIYRMIHSIEQLQPFDKSEHLRFEEKKKETVLYLISELLSPSQQGTLSILILQAIATNLDNLLLPFALSHLVPTNQSLQRFADLSEQAQLSSNPYLRKCILRHLGRLKFASSAQRFISQIKSNLLPPPNKKSPRHDPHQECDNRLSQKKIEFAINFEGCSVLAPN